MARIWVFVVRWIAALAIFGVVLVVTWYCWFSFNLAPNFRPGSTLRVGLAVAVGMTLASVLLLTPAVLSGAFSGDSQQGMLGLLLSTRVTAGEIVFSRFISRLIQVGMVVAAGLPGVCFLAAYAGTGLRSLVMLILLTCAVSAGSAGIALSFSVLFNRARDALIGTYVVGLAMLFLSGAVSTRVPSGIAPWIVGLNPLSCLRSQIEHGQSGPTWHSILLWSAFALVGVLTTSWLLRPTYLRRSGGKNNAKDRRRRVPPLGDCPIRWKELYIESDKDFGRLTRIIGKLLLFLMFGGSALLLTLFIWSSWASQSPAWVKTLLSTGAVWLGTLLLPMSWLVQWGVGVRAAAGIATEKERGTWDALMMTPLSGGQIVQAKMMESFYSLRWFLTATLIVCLLGAMLQAVELAQFAAILARTIVSIGFMSAVGVWSSLYATTSGKAMTLTLAGWLFGKVAFYVTGALLTLVGMLGYLLMWSAIGIATGRRSRGMPPPLMSFELAMTLFDLALCIVATISIAWYCRVRFDRLAGRCPERTVPTSMDQNRLLTNSQK